MHHNIVADCFNIFAGILSIAMWIPQILTTYINKNEGTLSLLSLGFHALGCIMVIIFQLLEKESFSTIIPYIVALLCESWILYYCFLQKRRNKPLIELDYNHLDDVESISLTDDNFVPKLTHL